MEEEITNDEPRYVISIAARMVGMQTYTLRYYERVGIIEPSRSPGKIRLYSDSDIARLKRAKTLMEDLGINLAGVEVILRMARHMNDLQDQVKQLESEVEELRKRR